MGTDWPKLIFFKPLIDLSVFCTADTEVRARSRATQHQVTLPDIFIILGPLDSIRMSKVLLKKVEI